MLLPHSTGRRQTLPDVINALDIESGASSSSNVAPITPRTPVMQATGGASGARARPVKGKKSFEETVSARKMSVPSDSAVSDALHSLEFTYNVCYVSFENRLHLLKDGAGKKCLKWPMQLEKSEWRVQLKRNPFLGEIGSCGSSMIAWF